jgi:hypothetical protein
MSFLNYYSARKSLNILTEMSKDALQFKGGGKEGKKIDEKRKTPIFIDWDDIRYLTQFPPAFWSTALAYRYSDLLFAAEHGIVAGKPIPDVQDVTLPHKAGTKVIFRGVNTGINKLHDKLTKDTNDLLFSKLGKEDAHKKEYKDKGHGYYGFVMGDPRITAKSKTTKGMVGMDARVVTKRLGTLRQGVREGWLSHDNKSHGWQDNVKAHDSDAKLLKMNFGGGGKNPTYVYGGNKLRSILNNLKSQEMNVPDKVLPNGKTVWNATLIAKDGSQRPIEIPGNLPILFPSKMIDNKSKNDFENVWAMRKQIGAALSDPNKLNQYYKLISDPHLSSQITNIKTELEQSKTLSGAQRKQLQSRLDLLNRASAIRGQLVSKLQEDGKLDLLKGGPANVEAIKKYLEGMKAGFETQAKEIQHKSEKLDLHDFNTHYFNPSTAEGSKQRKYTRPHKNNYTGYGTVHVNNQQKAAIHGGQSGMWEDEGLQELLGTAGNHQVPNSYRSAVGSEFVPYVRKKTYNDDPKIKDNLEKQIAKREKALAAGKINMKNKGEVALNDRMKRSLQQEIFRLKEELKGSKILWGPIGQGINDWLTKEYVYGSPEYFAMTGCWDDLFQCAYVNVRSNIGQGEFNVFFDAKQSGGKGEELQAHWDKVQNKVRHMAKDYAGSMWQLDLRRGTRRLRKGKADVSLDSKKAGSGQDGEGKAMGEMLSDAENKLHSDIAKIAYARTKRIKSGGDIFGHDITAMRELEEKQIAELIDRESQEAKSQITAGSDDPNISHAEVDQEQQLKEKLYDTALAFQTYRTYFIYTKEIEKKAGGGDANWSMEDANAYAASQVREMMGEKGIKLSNHNPMPKADADVETAQDSKKSSIQSRLDHEDLNSLDKHRGVGASSTSSALGKMIDRLDDTPEDERAGLLQKLKQFVIGQASEPDAPDMRQMVNDVFEKYGQKAPFEQELAAAAKTQGSGQVMDATPLSPEKAQALKPIWVHMQSPDSIEMLNPKSPKYSQKWAMAVNRIAGDMSMPQEFRVKASELLGQASQKVPGTPVAPATPAPNSLAARIAARKKLESVNIRNQFLNSLTLDEQVQFFKESLRLLG